MTNEERIYKLCEYIIDLIDILPSDNKTLTNNLEWVRNEVMSIREDINNC